MLESKLRAIETKYDGHLFRSRLEARWAVLFKNLGVYYQYEEQGYDLDGNWYLPDFYLPDMDCFVEVKGSVPNKRERQMAYLLSKYSGVKVHVVSGSIPYPAMKEWARDRFDIFTFDYNDKAHTGRDLYVQSRYTLNICPKCNQPGFAVGGVIGNLPCGCLKNSTSNKIHKRITSAFFRARSARFEYFRKTKPRS